MGINVVRWNCINRTIYLGMPKRIRKKVYRPGVYMLTNPIGEIYIGQTMNLDRRKREHRQFAEGRPNRHRKLSESLVKYGFDAHKFEIIYEFPKDVSRDVLLNYEYFIFHQYNELGFKFLNLQECGTSVPLEETRLMVGKRFKEMWQDEAMKKHLIKCRTGKPIHSEEEKQKRSQRMKELRSKLGEQYKFSKDDTAKAHAAQQKLLVERGYVVHPDITEKLRQNKSRIILNTQTGVYYYGCLEAAKYNNTTEDNLRKKLKGQYKNNTPLIFV